MAGEAGHFDFEGVRFGTRTWTARPLSADRRSSGAAELSAGSPASPFVLVHGFAQSAASWEGVAPALADGASSTVYALDLMGHGESERLDCADFYDIGFQARAVLAFCELVAQAEGALPVLVGYSMGGRMALCAAEEALRGKGAVPFRALVLESAGLGPADASARDALAKRNAEWAARLRGQGVRAFMGYWEALPLFESQKALDAPTRARVSAERLANDADALAPTFERAGAHAMPLRSEAIAALRTLRDRGAHVAYLAGALDEKYCAVAKALGAELGGAACVGIVPNAGHNVHLEQPEAFASGLLDFARSCS